MRVLWECSLRAILMAGGIGTALRLLRIEWPEARHRAWLSVLAGMLLLPAVSLWAPRMAVRVLPALPEPPGVEPWTLPPADTAPVAIAPQPRELRQMPDPLLMLYLAGAGFLLARLILGTARAAALKRGASSEGGFFSSAACASPLTVGWLRPAVIVPSDWRKWPAAELESVLAHERAHVRRRDPFTQWLAAFNRCIFWFHPLAWWLQRQLEALAEEACDDEVVAGGREPREYCAYLLRQAQAVERTGGRIMPGTAMGGASLAKRVRRLLRSTPPPRPSSVKARAATALCGCVLLMCVGCELERTERPAAGQPTENQLMHRRTEALWENSRKMNAWVARGRLLTRESAEQLAGDVRRTPEEPEPFYTLIDYYYSTGDLRDLDDLRLWYIEHRPDGRLYPGPIDPQADRSAYDRGKALWLANLERRSVQAEAYGRAAEFIRSTDKPRAESILETARKAYPNESRIVLWIGELYARGLAGEEPKDSAYASSLRSRLAQSDDSEVLAQTAGMLIRLVETGTLRPDVDVNRLARSYLDRAQSLAPGSPRVRNAKRGLAAYEEFRRIKELEALAPGEMAKISDDDRMLLTLFRMRQHSYVRPEDAAADARSALALAQQNPRTRLYGDAVFEANIILGKVELRGGHKAAAARYLLASAATPGSSTIQGGEFEMNLPRALLDWGERRAVASFLDRMAPKTARAQQFREWAAEIRKGINPDLIPTFTARDCSQDPC